MARFGERAAAVRLGPAAGVGMDDDVGGREGFEDAVLGLDHHLVGGLEREGRVEVGVQLDVDRGA